ncbi:rubredoxin [Methanothermobacter sp. CaT2]|uniref:rubredoxin n=1 Tax=Methanothermobacter sp. CaT2 TaxID=866790 RepID=UPI0002CD02AB|nr:rubredoxin [Methanothermobacter sp. CaT2]BAM70474.1 putative rubredoxin [Methanothermobacter sp. CaT2]
MKICRICGYQIPEGEFNLLEDGWVCPRCGVGKEEFEDSTEPLGGRDPLMLIFRAMTVGLWRVLGNGSQGVTREMGSVIADNIRHGEDPLKSAADYFIEHGFAASISADTENFALNVKNCSFYGFCRSLEEDGVLLSTCPYANTAAAVLERTTGYRYRIKRNKGDHGHIIEFSRISKK